MTNENKIKFMKIALVMIGLIYIFGIFTLMKILPDSWGWEPHQHEYELMIMGIYATLGVFLLLASLDPLANRSLIWFTIASNIVHGFIMLSLALLDPAETPNLWGDIPALFLIAMVLWVLMPKKPEPS